MDGWIDRQIDLTNRFQVAVRLFSNRSQMTSKCVKNKEWMDGWIDRQGDRKIDKQTNRQKDRQTDR